MGVFLLVLLSKESFAAVQLDFLQQCLHPGLISKGKDEKHENADITVSNMR